MDGYEHDLVDAISWYASMATDQLHRGMTLAAQCNIMMGEALEAELEGYRTYIATGIRNESCTSWREW